MTVRSRRLWGPLHVVTSGPTVTYTVPAGHVAVVRQLLVVNTGTVDNEGRIFLVNGPVANGRVWNHVVAGKENAEVKDLVFDPGDQIRFTANTVGGSTLAFAGYGALLELP